MSIENNFEEFFWGGKIGQDFTTWWQKDFLIVSLWNHKIEGRKKQKKTNTLLPSQAKACSKAPKAQAPLGHGT
jgi:hypothetical protein